MKNLKDIIEGQNFLVNKKLVHRQDKYEFYPEDRTELKDIIIELLKKGITDLNCIDVSKITDMAWLFHEVHKIINIKYIDISDWDVSNVTNMRSMFEECYEFNSDLSKWNVSKVTDMFSMFFNCEKFNSDLSKWNVSNVKDMLSMFYRCNTLIKNNKIPKWYSN